MYLTPNHFDLIITAMEAERDATTDMAEDAIGEEKSKLMAQSDEESNLLDLLYTEQNNYAKGKFVNLDADQQIHYLNVLAEYHTLLNTRIMTSCYKLFKTKEVTDVMDTCYLLGNIEGRMIHNGTTQSDLDILEGWETELLVEGEDKE